MGKELEKLIQNSLKKLKWSQKRSKRQSNSLEVFSKLNNYVESFINNNPPYINGPISVQIAKNKSFLEDLEMLKYIESEIEFITKYNSHNSNFENTLIDLYSEKSKILTDKIVPYLKKIKTSNPEILKLINNFEKYHAITSEIILNKNLLITNYDYKIVQNINQNIDHILTSFKNINNINDSEYLIELLDLENELLNNSNNNTVCNNIEKTIYKIVNELDVNFDKINDIKQAIIFSKDNNLQTISTIKELEEKFKIAENLPNAKIHNEQIVSALASYYSNKGISLDVKTGEGKTLISALTAKLFNNDGRFVDIYTANNELALRDYEKYKSYGLDVGLILCADNIVKGIETNKKLEELVKTRLNALLILDSVNNIPDFIDSVINREISEEDFKINYSIIDKFINDKNLNETEIKSFVYSTLIDNAKIEIETTSNEINTEIKSNLGVKLYNYLFKDDNSKIEFIDNLTNSSNLSNSLKKKILESNESAYTKKTIVTTLENAVFDYERRRLHKKNPSDNFENGRNRLRNLDVVICDESDNNAFSENPYTITKESNQINKAKEHYNKLLTSAVFALKSDGIIDKLKDDKYFHSSKYLPFKLLDRMSSKDDQKPLNQESIELILKSLFNDNFFLSQINDIHKSKSFGRSYFNHEYAKNNISYFAKIINKYFIEVKNNGFNKNLKNIETIKSKLSPFFKDKSGQNIKDLITVDTIETLGKVITNIGKGAHLIEDKDYYLENGKVILLNKNSKEPMKNSKYSEGLQEAIELIKYNQIIDNNNKIDIDSMTGIEYLNLFKHKVFLSGSNQIGDHITKEIFGLDTLAIPVHKYNNDYTKKSIDDILSENFDVYLNKDEKHAEVIRKINESVSKDKSVLIIGDLNELKELKQLYSNSNLLSHENIKDYQEIIENAGKTGQVTFATFLGARGADIKTKSPTNDNHELSEGLDVIVINANNKRELEQAVGRTNRQGNTNGTAEILLSIDDEYLGAFKNSTSLFGNRMTKWQYKNLLVPYLLYSKDEQLKSSLIEAKRKSTNEMSESFNPELIAKQKSRLEHNFNDIYESEKTTLRQGVIDPLIQNYYWLAPLTMLGTYFAGNDGATAISEAVKSGVFLGGFQYINDYMNRGNGNPLNTGGKTPTHYSNMYSYLTNKAYESYIYALSALSMLSSNTFASQSGLFVLNDLLKRNDAGNFPFFPLIETEDKVSKSYKKKFKKI